MRSIHLYENRTLCDILEEIRICIKTQNYSYLPGLIEEVQSTANRMESGLGDIKDIKRISNRKRALKKEIRKLEKDYKKLGGKLDD